MSEEKIEVREEAPEEEQVAPEPAESSNDVVNEEREAQADVVRENTRGEKAKICRSIFRMLMNSGLDVKQLDEVHQRVVAELGD